MAADISPIFEIAEVGGERRVLLLQGPALPHADTLSYRSRMILQTEHYGVDTDQQVVGEEEQPSSPSGVWVDQMLAAGGPWATFAFVALYTGADIASAVDLLRRGGEELRVTFGDFVRYGRIEETEFTPGRAGRLAWSIDFNWTGRTNLPDPQERIPTPPSVPDLFTQAMETALEGIDWFESMTAFAATTVQDVLDRYVRGPLSVVTAGGIALQQVSRLVETSILDSFVAMTDYIRAASSYADTVGRMGGIGGAISAQCMDAWDAIEDLGAERFAGTNDPATQIEAGREVGAASRLFAEIAMAAGKVIWMAQRSSQTHRPDYRVHVARQGETLYDVARRYYGDEERWTDLALHNGTAGPTLYAGQEIVIP